MKINQVEKKIVNSSKSVSTKNQQYSPNLKQKQDEYIAEKKPTFKEKLSAFSKKFKTAIIAGVSILAGALSVFAVMKKQTNSLEKENISLNQQKKELEESKKNLEKEKQILEDKLKNISTPENYGEMVSIRLEDVAKRATQILEQKKLDAEAEAKADGFVFVAPSTSDFFGIPMSSIPEQTNNRANMKDLHIPDFKKGEPYSFSFPESEEMKITHETSKFVPIPLKTTTISSSYSDSLNWDDNKISRDLLQNFFDGHGQTLDGVNFNVTPNQDGTYKVRIEGKSTFTPEKAILLGETTKKEDKHAAGQFGEGLKMVVLKLLKEKGAQNVNVASDNWTVSWQLSSNDELSGKEVLAYELKETEPFNGNFIEFDTNNENLIKSLIGSFNNFYHSNNPSFKCPQFENDKLGVRILDKTEKGKLFIAGQAFEVEGSYTGLEGIEIFLKEKPPIKDGNTYIFDPSRDRTSLNSKDIKSIGKWLGNAENMSKEDYIKLIHTLEPYWEVRDMNDKSNEAAHEFLEGLLDYQFLKRPNFLISFPDKKCIADAYNVSANLKQTYRAAGYKICTQNLSSIGMTSINQLIEESRKHKEIPPTEIQQQKIILIKDAIKLLAPKLQELNLFDAKELDPKIVIFDRSSEFEDDYYKTVNAEAIIESNKSIGFWVDKEFLNSNFSTLLSTALHELTHKYGGDETPSFSYKLTDVLDSVLDSLTKDATISKELKVLEGAWNKLNQ